MANVRGLSDINKDGHDDDEDRQDFFTGGESSGMVVQGPTRKENDGSKASGDHVGSIFDRARELGAREGTVEDMEEKRVFTGAGRTLEGNTRRGEQSRVVVTFYNNGVFTVNDGPGRSVTDPANKAFLDSMAKGIIPAELEPEDGSELDVNLVRKDEPYKEPERPRYQAFQGTGRTLSSAGPSSSVSAAAASPAPAMPTGSWAGVDESAPTTSLQLRLHDGSRLVARFNHTHTLADVRHFLITARPDLPVLSDDSKSLKELGLLQAVLIQK